MAKAKHSVCVCVSHFNETKKCLFTQKIPTTLPTLLLLPINEETTKKATEETFTHSLGRRVAYDGAIMCLSLVSKV